MHANLPFWLSTLFMPNVGPLKILRWLESFEDIRALFAASQDEQHQKGIAKKYAANFKTPNSSAIAHELAWIHKSSHHHLICYEDEQYPPLLKRIADPPLVLYVQGELSALEKMQIAIVGSRTSTETGKQNAHQFASYLAQTGFAITSGLAIGIDGAAHRGALSVQGVTLGVAGTGLSQQYPPMHRKLIADIADQGGAILSEFPIDTPPLAMHFPRRNRIIAGMSIGVLVIEAAMKSGSLITARHAIELGREVFAIPGSIHNPLARGCHHLLKQGAKLVETASDIVNELGSLMNVMLNDCDENKVQQLVAATLPSTHNILLTKANKPSSPQILKALPQDFAEQYHTLYACLSTDTTPLDAIVSESGLTAGEVSSMLLTLELSGYIEAVVGGYRRFSI